MRYLGLLTAVLAALFGCGEDGLSSQGPPPAQAESGPAAARPIPSPPRPWPDALREAVIALERGDLDDARLRAKAYHLAAPDDAQGLFVVGLVHHRQQDYAVAEPYFERALAADPGQTVIHHFLGYCRFYLGDLAGARASFAAHLAAAPEESDSHFGLGLVELEEGHLDAAETCFNDALARIAALETANPPAFQTRRRDAAKIYARLGDVAFLRGDYEDARERLYEAVAIDPNLYAAYFLLSQVERRLGNDDVAERLQTLFEQMAARRGQTAGGGP